MMKWIADANEFSGTEGMTFDEVVQYAAFFFSQRHSEEGLKYVFELFDPERKGYLLKGQLDQAFAQCGILLHRDQLDEIFKKASSDGKILKFSEFSFFMRTVEM